MKISICLIFIFFTFCSVRQVFGTDTCSADSVSCRSEDIDENDDPDGSGFYSKQNQKSYLLYEVNPGEGFNLRRDVYMRIATLVRLANKANPNANWVLVLPPWGPLYHWRSMEAGYQSKIPWGEFFDLSSLSKYVPVMEFHEFLETRGPVIDKIYYLQNYEDMWSNGRWEEKMNISECIEKPIYYRLKDGAYKGLFWGYYEPRATEFDCLSVQGRSSTLLPLLVNSSFQAIMIDRAEVILHEVYGDYNYWMVRRSMRFAEHLVEVGNLFRLRFLDSDDENDKTVQNENWLNYTKERNAIGGPYISAHLRRQDFVRSRAKDVPSIENAAKQLKEKLEEYGLSKVFIATDAPESEMAELKQYLPEVVQLRPTAADIGKFKDGGIAIIDQWICAHARYFIGSYESTFSFRIQEEREILGFKPESTFNRLCGDNQTSCNQPAKWKIVFE